MKGKLFTIVGIVVIFGYFISESFKNPSDPTQVVLIGNDTLGQDWGAIAEQKIKDQNALLYPESDKDKQVVVDIYSNAPETLLPDDPYQREKLNSANYFTVQDGNGREVVTSYTREEQLEQNDNYKTRHQAEKNTTEEPSVIYKQ